MTFEVRYNGNSSNITVSEFKSIADSVDNWVSSDANRKWQSISYDINTQQLRIAVSVVGVAQADISSVIDTVSSGVSSINTTHGASYPTTKGITVTPE